MTTAEPATPDGSGPALVQIGEVASRTELSLRSLRHWEEVGLLVPSGRSEGGFRLYSEADVEKILVIRRMKPLGFSIEEMKAVMADLEAVRGGSGDPDAARAHLEAVRDEALERRRRIERQLARADEFIALLQGEVAGG